MLRITEYLREQNKLIKKYERKALNSKNKEGLSMIFKKLFEEATLLGIASSETEIELMTKKHLSERASKRFRITLSDTKKTKSVTDRASDFWDSYSLKLAGDFEESKLREVEKMFKEKFKESGYTRAEIMKDIQEKLDIKNKVRLNMIVTTETTKCFNYGRVENARDNFKNGGIVRGLRFNAVMDVKTSPTCQSRNGKVLAIDDPRVDMNTPPLHVNCRSLWSYVNKWDWEELYGGKSSPEWITSKSIKETKPDDSWGNAFAYGGEKEKLAIQERDSIIKIDKFEDSLPMFEKVNVKIDESLKQIDKQLMVDNVNQLNYLINKHPIAKRYLEEKPLTFKSVDKGSYIGRCSINSTEQIIELNQKYFDSFEEYTKGQIEQIGNNWKMPTAKEKLSTYTLNHEFGHFIQNTIIENIKENKSDEFYKVIVKAMGQNNEREARLIIKRWYDKQASEIRKEIINIAHEIDKSINQRTYVTLISDYGKSSNQEFFAECFANMEGGEPNILAKALRIYLERVNSKWI